MLLASFLTGASVNVVYPDVPQEDLNIYLNIASPDVVWYGEKENALQRNKEIVLTELPPRGPKEYVLPVIDVEDHTPMILFTSGTTGIPKAICISEASFSALAASSSIAPYQKLLVTSVVSWLTHSFFTISVLVHGRSIVIPKKKFTTEDLLRAIDCYKPDFWFGTYSVLHELMMCENLSKYNLSSLKMIVSGGSRFPAEKRRLIMDKVFKNRLMIIVTYGTTEMSWITKWTDGVDISSDEYNTVGVVAKGVMLKVVDVDSGKELGQNQEGEICVKSQIQMRGILNVRTEDIEELDPNGWFHTGDIGYYDEKGLIYIVSRKKEMFKYKGHQITPAEIEKVILSHEAVDDVCVVGLEKEGIGAEPAAAVTLKPGAKVTEKEIESFVADKVADYRRLRGGVIFVKSIPKNQTGKTLFRLVEKLFQNR